MIKIREVLRSEIDLLQNFPPEDWKLDLPKFVSYHFDFEYFYAAVAEIDDKICGFGNGIMNGNTVWIGNIIVLPEYRRRGAGYELTQHLIEYFKMKGCSSYLLIATQMGKNIYSMTGFRAIADYNVYRTEKALIEFEINSNIRSVEPEDYPQILELDREITGESRQGFIERFFLEGFVYKSKKYIEGFYLPGLGAGFIAAKNKKAGLELLKLRLSGNTANTVIPAGNEAANLFLKSLDCQLVRIIPRMVIGEDVWWKPDLIFSRGAGYCG